MQPIASNPPTASIYRCEHGGIHLICQNINVGLQLSIERFSAP